MWDIFIQEGNTALLSDVAGIVMGGGGLPNKGRYGCAASTKPRLGKISPKT